MASRTGFAVSPESVAIHDSACAAEGWALIHDSARVRCYARGGLVTVGATLALYDGKGASIATTLLGRGRTIEEAVTDLGRHGVF